MKILMLGWEYPPHISGGLGTACEGLTRGLARQGVDLTFVVPRLFGGENAPHMMLFDSQCDFEAASMDAAANDSSAGQPLLGRRSVVGIPSHLKPYMGPEAYDEWISSLRTERARRALAINHTTHPLITRKSVEKEIYGGDIFSEVTRYAADVAERFKHVEFDLIHAHDWLTYPAGVALSTITGKPLVVHVHSLEHDRSGDGRNEHIHQIERWGLHAAHRIIAVSYYTRSLVSGLHGVPLDKISVVHNGVYAQKVVQSYRQERQWSSRMVLFLGRITFQKGPDYFVEAAARVIPHVPDVLFVMAGAGDMLPQIQRRIHELGIEKHFFFPGFLRGSEVEQMFSLADVYVMPSVSEPFGISALEAISFSTPVIISRQSGVAEVLGHALKVDFWDVDKLADLIINALLHEELRADMIAMAREEVKRLHWDAAAQKSLEVYRMVLNGREYEKAGEHLG